MNKTDDYWVRLVVDEAKKKFQDAALSHGFILEGSEIKSAKEDVEMLRSHALYTGFSENWRKYALRVKLLASILLLIPIVFLVVSYLNLYEISEVTVALLFFMILFGAVFLYLISRMEFYFGSWLGVPDPTWRKPFRHVWQFVPPRWEAK
ncbi:hypothetical protein [Labrenzia sp. OB1]|uniref:hypothetical protein n=1 Tax=Labrenzia sp. OB1 TaxID=1561204 RepID=UPI0007B17BA6|nr:hypothetical protein [Labrenzia sp. OB1]KZM48963.1 hypothetical protein OA90_17340 [Labrenzia sp. OB1]